MDILILNDNGEEVLDKRIMLESLDDLGNMDTLGYNLMNNAKTNEKIDGMIFSSKEDYDNSDEYRENNNL